MIDFGGLNTINGLLEKLKSKFGGYSEAVELTQEEYDALPDTKNTDGKTYFIKNESGGVDSEIDFDSQDVQNPESYSDMALIESNEKPSTLFGKLTLAVKNIRWLFGKIGTTDISALGDGTVTGAITQLYSDWQNITNTNYTYTTFSEPFEYTVEHTGICYLLSATNKSVSNNSIDIYINGVSVIKIQAMTESAMFYNTKTLFLKKGDILKLTTGSGVTSRNFTLYFPVSDRK